METLHLVLKRKWWDMYVSGEKPEEYRDITGYWCNRLMKNGCSETLLRCVHGDKIVGVLVQTELKWKNYDAVTFHLGYTKTTMTYEFKSISIGKGNPNWGAPTDRNVFIIKLGNRL